jgi:hypothetical protein
MVSAMTGHKNGAESSNAAEQNPYKNREIFGKQLANP